MKKLTENKIKYIGNGVLEVTKPNGLVEKYKLEKGDNLLESVKKLNEEFIKNYEAWDGDNLGYWVGPGWGSTSLVLYPPHGQENYYQLEFNITRDNTRWIAMFKNEKDARKFGEAVAKLEYDSAKDIQAMKVLAKISNAFKFRIL